MTQTRRAVTRAAALLMFATPLAAVSHADAAVSPTGVVIGKISAAKAGKKISPKVTAGSNVSVLADFLIAKQGSKTTARGSSIKLRPGTYSLTTTVLYQVKNSSTALVSDGTTPVPMNCQVSDVQINEVNGYQVELEFLDCTGAFDGVYKARAAYVDDPNLRATYGPMIWGDSFVVHPDVVPPVIGTKFAATVKPVTPVYLTTTSLSAAKTIKKTQTLIVR